MAAWSFAASVAITIVLWLLGKAWNEYRMTHIDGTTLLMTCVGVLEALYLPAIVATTMLSRNIHQPSDVASFLALFVQTFLMVMLVIAAFQIARRLRSSGRRPVPESEAGIDRSS